MEQIVTFTGVPGVIEKNVNKWLKENKDVKIIDRFMSSQQMPDRDGNMFNSCNIVIFYKKTEKPVKSKVAKEASATR